MCVEAVVVATYVFPSNWVCYFLFPVFAEDIPHIVDATLTWLTNDWVSIGLEKVPSLPELQQEVLLMGLYRKFET